MTAAASGSTSAPNRRCLATSADGVPAGADPVSRRQQQAARSTRRVADGGRRRCVDLGQSEITDARGKRRRAVVRATLPLPRRESPLQGGSERACRVGHRVHVCGRRTSSGQVPQRQAVGQLDPRRRVPDRVPPGPGPRRVMTTPRPHGNRQSVSAAGPTASWILATQTSVAFGSQAARSARRGSLENISTIGLVDADALLEPLDLELLVPEHERDHHAGLAGPGGAARSGAGRPCGPRAGRSARRRRCRRRGCRGRRRRWPPAPGSLPSAKSAQRLLAAPAGAGRRGWRRPATPSSLERLGQPVGAPLGADEHQRAAVRRAAMAAATFTLSISWTGRKRCSISSTVTVSETTSWKTGSCW